MILPLSDHARFEMQRRRISEQDIERVWTQPEQKIVLARGRAIWQNKITDGGKVYILRLVIETAPTMRIITLYRSSKVKKYWREEP
ncbi:MAG: DUF4258 domain-containing protein [Deltaproteobacteria bacterium]|nr:DUF4258 domain-containing protein [Deltaproteobacteria bacterium]